MPLFNLAADFTVTESSKSLILTSQQNFIRDDYPGTQLISASSTTRVLVTVTNTGDKDIFVGFTTTTNNVNYIARIKPSGLYESALNYRGDIHCWAEASGTFTVAIFSEGT